MRERGFGRVISIGSGASKRAAGIASGTPPPSTGCRLHQATCRDDGPQHGITVNLLCPGWTNTSLLDFEKVAKRAGTSVEEAMAVADAENAQHRVLEPDELTGMATLLASDEGAGITGQVISVDGGYRL